MVFDVFKDPVVIAVGIAAAAIILLGPVFIYIALSRWVF